MLFFNLYSTQYCPLPMCERIKPLDNQAKDTRGYYYVRKVDHRGSYVIPATLKQLEEILNTNDRKLIIKWYPPRLIGEDAFKSDTKD